MTDTLTGNDLSHYQTSIDWAQADRQLGFAMLKASQGTGYVDPTYADRITHLRAAGERRGSYHYADGADPIAEADHYVQAAGRLNGEMQALDFEGAILNHADPVGWCVRWFGRVIDRTDNIPLIYMSRATVARFDWSRLIALNVGLWCASWGSTKPDPGPWPFVIMWQRDDDGHLAGVTGDVDEDVFYGDAQTWAKYAHNRSTSHKEEPAPGNPHPTPPAHSPSSPAPSPAPSPRPPASSGTYTVRQGDNLSSIGQAHGVSVKQLIAWNRDRYPSLGHNPNLIQPGWRLVVRHGAEPANPVYTVREGDTLSGIAKAHHTSVHELVALNHSRYSTLVRNPDHIETGWKLYLP